MSNQPAMPINLDRIALALGRAVLENIVLQEQIDAASPASDAAAKAAADLHAQRNRNRDESNAI